MRRFKTARSRGIIRYVVLCKSPFHPEASDVRCQLKFKGLSRDRSESAERVIKRQHASAIRSFPLSVFFFYNKLDCTMRYAATRGVYTFSAAGALSPVGKQVRAALNNGTVGIRAPVCTGRAEFPQTRNTVPPGRTV